MNRRRQITLACLALGVTACAPGPVRNQSLFLHTRHVALFVDDQGRGAYVLELGEVRNAPPLGEIEVAFDRPGMAPWIMRHTVAAGDTRFRFATPYFRGFETDRYYDVRVRLLHLDRFTELDRLRQRVRPTPAGAGATPAEG